VTTLRTGKHFMNISRIRQMAAQGDMSVDALRYLLDCHGECEHLDFKEHFDLDNDYGVLFVREGRSWDEEHGWRLPSNRST